MDKKRFWDSFPLGTHLCREPMPPMAELKRDMEIIKSKGFNMVKLQENWLVDEPSEGNVDLSKYHELISRAQELDMGVYVGLTCEQAPSWLYEKHPDCRMVRQDGCQVNYAAQTTLPADGKPGPCYDHPGATEDQLRFIRRLVGELSIHENIVVWNTWQEIGYWAEWFAGECVCYCENTLASYRAWLSGRYGSEIKKLNAHWNANYASFESINPDRSRRVNCVPQRFFFRYFMDNVQVASVLRSRCEAIKEADALSRPVFAHKGSPDFGSGMDWTYARTQDFIGMSSYPAWGSGSGWDDHKRQKRLPRYETLLAEMWDNVAKNADYIRSASAEGKPVWFAEFQGGPVSTDFHIGRIPEAADVRRWMLSAIGSGITALSFWVARAEIMAPEANGFSLLDPEGETTERLEEASAIGRFFQKYPDVFAKNNKPQAEVAILVDEWNTQLMRTMSQAPEAHAYDARGWYKFCWDAGVPCDFVEASQLGEKRAYSYKAIVVPLPLSMSGDLAGKLVECAKAGVCVLLEGACGRLSDTGYATRGQMNAVIRGALGANVKTFRLIREPGDEDRWTPGERTWGEFEDEGKMEGAGALSGCKIRANAFIETYEAEGCEAIFKFNGKTSGIEKKIGSGKIILAGTCLGHNATAYVENDSVETARKLLMHCGVRIKNAGGLLVSRRVGEKLSAYIIVNPHERPLTETIPLPEGGRVVDAYGSAVTQEGGGFEITVGPLDATAVVFET
ncbi:MAG: beta-galactosidase [Defluviitaleaceae bacterium]|nr:beta-galactosidase [Defluviitaleaceae bacterium]